MELNQKIESGILYVVATPIGNLKDITYRAVEILKTVDLILCEDTRTSHVLLKNYNITTKVTSYHAYSTDKKHAYIISLLEQGYKIGLISDAGTPGISDPGSLLIQTIKQSYSHILVLPIPGVTAITTLLSVSGFTQNEFTFLGFVPHKKGRETFFKEIGKYTHSTVFYESSHRILKTLFSLKQLYATTHVICIGREMTKLFETYMYGNIVEIEEKILLNLNQQKGEFVLLLIPRKKIQSVV